MRVWINKTGSNNKPAGIDRPRRRKSGLCGIANEYDAVTPDANVGLSWFFTCAVDEFAVQYQQVKRLG